MASPQAQLDELKDQRTALEKKRDDARKQVNIGAIGILIGLLMFFALGGFWPFLGGLIGLAGLLGVLTNVGTANSSERQLKGINEQITEIRKQL